jgi:adenylylsulfate kinase
MFSKGHVFWLFGHSGAGKTTLSQVLASALREKGHPVLELDGDVLRSGLCAGLGFTKEARHENLRRSANVAALSLRSGISVVAAFITPLEENRTAISSIIAGPALSFVYLDAPVSVCQLRDPKGIYAAARIGRVPEMTGMSSPFEPPQKFDLRLDTADRSLEICSKELIDFALRKL